MHTATQGKSNQADDIHQWEIDQTPSVAAADFITADGSIQGRTHSPQVTVETIKEDLTRENLI